MGESLEYYGIKLRFDASERMRRAWEHSDLSEQYALAVALKPVKAVRRKHRAICVACVLNGMLTASLAFVVFEALLADCRVVLLRPKPVKPHRQSVRAIDRVLTNLAQDAIVLKPVAAPPAPDPGDRLFWELLAARADLVLVTGCHWPTAA